MNSGFIKKNIDIFVYLFVLILLVSGFMLSMESLFRAAYVLAILSIFFTKSPSTTEISKDTDERDLFIIAKSTNIAYGFILLFVVLWEVLSFEKNIFSQFNLDIHNTLKIVLAVVYFSYTTAFSYYKRKL